MLNTGEARQREQLSHVPCYFKKFNSKLRWIHLFLGQWKCAPSLYTPQKYHFLLPRILCNKIAGVTERTLWPSGWGKLRKLLLWSVQGCQKEITDLLLAIGWWWISPPCLFNTTAMKMRFFPLFTWTSQDLSETTASGKLAHLLKAGCQEDHKTMRG